MLNLSQSDANDPFLDSAAESATDRGSETGYTTGGTAMPRRPVWGKRQNIVLTFLPWIMCVIAFANMTFTFYYDPMVVYAVVFVLFCLCAIMTSADAIAGRKMLFYSGILGMFGICIAVGMGSFIYQRWVKQYFHLKSSRVYENVLPTESAAAHMDGGVLNFAVGTAVDTPKSVGYMINGKIYCVAPIMNADSVSVEFWAVGMNCCGSRSAFFCDGAGEGTAADEKSGLVMQSYGGLIGAMLTSPDVRHHRAIKQAKAYFDLVGTNDPLLVRFVNRDQVKSVMNEYIHTPVMFFTLACLSFLGVTAGSAWMVTKIQKNKMMKKKTRSFGSRQFAD